MSQRGGGSRFCWRPQLRIARRRPGLTSVLPQEASQLHGFIVCAAAWPGVGTMGVSSRRGYGSTHGLFALPSSGLGNENGAHYGRFPWGYFDCAGA